MSTCADCPYKGDSCGFRGPIDAPVVIVGEAPSFNDLAAGKPFSGDAGQLLKGVIAAAGYGDLPILYTNAMVCKPDFSDEPFAKGIAACRMRLLAEVNMYPRRMVIALGTSALRGLIGGAGEDTKLRGQFLKLFNGTPLMVTYRPGAVLRAVGYYRHFARDIRRALAVGAGEPRPDPGETQHVVLDAAGTRALVPNLLALPHGQLVAFDVETTGLNPRLNKVTFLGISYEPHHTFIIPAAHIPLLAPAMLGANARWVGHNVQFDVKFLQAAGLDVPLHHDTQIMSYCLDEVPGGHGLKALANEHLGTNDYEAALDVYKKKHGIVGDYSQIPNEILLPYLAMDADYTLRLANLLLPQVEAQPDLKHLYYNTLLPATRALLKVEAAGLWMDPERTELARASITVERDNRLAELEDLAYGIWDTEAYRRDTGSRAGVKGPSAAQVAHISSTDKKKIDWMLKRLELGYVLPSLQEKALRDAIAALPTDRVAGHFLQVLQGLRMADKELKALRKEEHTDKEAIDAANDLKTRAKAIFDSWEHAYWKPAEYQAERETRTAVDFTPGSPAQVLWLLKKMGIPVSNTQEDTIKGYAATVPFIESLLGYRGAVKSLGTYVDAISEIVAKEPDGRVHATFRLTTVVTGRLSSAEPNLQNIPRDPMLRGMFGAPPGRILVEADLSQAELRVLAHLSGDAFLRQVYAEGRDLHSEMAASVFGPNFTPEQRTKTKILNFGVIYGMSAHSLSAQFEMPLKEAEGIITRWYERVPQAKAYLEACRQAPLKGHVLTTPFGRRRRYGLITNENMDAVQREATNYAIQSTASDIALHAAIVVQPQLPALDAFIVNIVHDSILVECPNDAQTPNLVARLLVETMRRIPAERIGFTVPMDADAKIGRHWGQMQKWKEQG